MSMAEALNEAPEALESHLTRHADPGASGFAALNTAFMGDGAYIHLPRGAVLDAEGTECTLNGLYMADGRQHVDFHTRVDHTRPRGTSHELYKGVLDGRSRGVFNGRGRGWKLSRLDAERDAGSGGRQSLL